MKHFKLFFRMPVFCVLMLLVPVTIFMQMRSDVIALNFDCLFPETSVQKVLETCMQIQHEFDVSSSCQNMDEYEASLFVDVVVGRLFHLLSCVQDIIVKKMLVHPEDACYIFFLVERLAATYDKKFQSIVPARGKHVPVFLLNIKRLLRPLVW